MSTNNETSLSYRCPLCEHHEAVLFSTYPTFQLVKCAQCAFIYQPVLEHQIEQYISEIYDAQWVQMREQYTEQTFHEHAAFNHLLIQMFYPYAAEKGRLLEIGSGTGEFLHLMNSIGWDVIGIEPSVAACEYASQTFNLPLRCDMFDPVKLAASEPIATDVQVICFWHVLEHQADPISFLQGAASLLHQDGIMLFSVPNLRSLTNQIHGLQSPLLSERDHLSHFTMEHIQMLLRKANLQSVSLFTRQEINRHVRDVSSIGQLKDKSSLSLQQLVKWQAELQSNGEGHEIVCVCKKGS
ncbi:class I SAM-dependent methyltransferase [Paenibacillus sp. 481]|uniref:class I SAM-dependent methyltransferase n=1 Tax=Paenibacillus sp. 481 TaxID=2835869 RepID=UPI001E5017FA|nr:class I SAM-dependent methyltransferase [Paenibacillus sp. 481]UHA72627.1 class I SAM-dependent methyltransferase [Paenibacillus sp. 481]